MLDLIIIGGSTSCTAALIYAARSKLDVKIVAKDLGGEVATSGEIGNYPGFNETNGIDLSARFNEQLKFNKVDVEPDIEIQSIIQTADGFKLTGWDIDGKEKQYQSKAVVVATGVRPRHLNIEGESELYQKGLSYCSTCDGPLFREKTVAVIGGGNAALESLLLMTNIAKQVYSININPEFKGEQVYIDKVKELKNVDIISRAKTIRIIGQERVSGLEYEVEGNRQTLTVDGIFVHIGVIPNSDFIKDLGIINKLGFIEVNKLMETSVPGVFAAGDVVDLPYNQIAISVGQGVTALLTAQSYLNRLR